MIEYKHTVYKYDKVAPSRISEKTTMIRPRIGQAWILQMLEPSEFGDGPKPDILEWGWRPMILPYKGGAQDCPPRKIEVWCRYLENSRRNRGEAFVGEDVRLYDLETGEAIPIIVLGF